MGMGLIGRSLPLAAAVVLLTAPAVHGQRLTSVVQALRPASFESSSVEDRVSISAQTTRSGATAKGAGVGLLAGALAGVAVAAMIEAGNEGGSPAIRENDKGFAYAVFVPTGAVLGVVVGAVIGARRH